MTTFKSFITSAFSKLAALPIVAKLVIIIVVAVGGYSAFSGNGNEATSDIFTISRAPLEQVVEFSGTVAPQDRVSLSFERAGRVVSAPYDIGDFVPRGATIASLDTSAVRADLEQAHAVLDSENATLDELKRGTRVEELSVAKAKVAQKEAAVNEAKEALVAALLSGYTTADTTLYKTIDDMFDNPTSAVPTLTYPGSSRAVEIQLENERLLFEGIMDTWQTQTAEIIAAAAPEMIANMPSSLSSLMSASAIAALSQDTETNLDTLVDTTDSISSYLLRLRAMLQLATSYTNKLSPSGSLTQTTIDAWRSSIATDRASVDTAIANVSAARENLVDARAALAIENDQFALAQAGSTTEDIAKQEAVIRAQNAKILSLESEYAKYIVRAPYNGTLIKRAYEIGEAVSAGATAVTLDSSGNYKMEAHISELDVVFLKEGMPAEITLDAYADGQTWSATITRVDPAESEKNGESGYGVELVFDNPDELLKAGMTANAIVHIILKDAVIAIPSGYIYEQNGKEFVDVLLENGDIESREIQTGTRNTRGSVEVVSGLNENERIAPYAEK